MHRLPTGSGLGHVGLSVRQGCVVCRNQRRVRGHHPPGFNSVRHGDPRLLVCFAGPFDAFLRRISVDMLDEAWRAAADVIVGLGLDPEGCRWAWAHPGVMHTTTDIPVDSALDGFGWLLPDPALRRLGLDAADPGSWAHFETLDNLFAGCDPPLMLVYSHYRCYEWVDAHHAPLPASDAVIGLELTFATLLLEMSDWRPRPDGGVGPWADIAHAMWRRDLPAFHGAISAAMRQYSAVGAEIVVRGFSDFLLHWTAYERSE